jgi:predicted RNA-binding protein associated with RNAse of E/G family
MGGLGKSAFKGWYVNLQEPVCRTALGFDFMDHALDIVITPDLSEWQWHDEDELEKAQERGLFSAQLVEQIWAEGEGVIANLESMVFPFGDHWETWCPPDWPIPELPRGWRYTDGTAGDFDRS